MKKETESTSDENEQENNGKTIDLERVEDEETEDEGEDEEGFDDDEEGQDPDHPAESLKSVIADIEEQVKRARTKNLHNLKFELGENVYPSILTGFGTILDWLCQIEDDLAEILEGEEGEDDAQVDESENEEIRKKIEEQVARSERMCRALSGMGNDIVVPEEKKQELREVIAWAEEMIANAEKARELKERADVGE